MSDKQAVSHNYDESKIKTLSSLEHIRTRPGMYIGRLGDGSHPDDGIYVLLKEAVDNCIDEFIMGYGKKIELSITEEGTVRVRDYGRGIPLGKMVECVSQINTGAKYNDEVFQFSVGLNGIGTKAVNALSAEFSVRSCRQGEFAVARFEKGELKEEENGTTSDPDGTEVVFKPDEEIFPHFQFDDSTIRRRLRNYAYLNSGLKIIYNDEVFHSSNGLYDLLSEKVEGETIYEIVYSKKNPQLEFTFVHTNSYGETYYSFVNGQYTKDGGTHLSAFREGILKGVNDFAGKNLEANDLRNGIVGAIAVKVQEPVFESQTKNKLGSSEIRGGIVSEVREFVQLYLHQHQEVAEKLLEKVSQNEKLRKDIQAVKKEAREKSKRASFKIPKLKDCRYHLNSSGSKGANTMLFLVEGQSAAGSIITARDVNTQAIFSLKGKPLNCYGMRQATVYRNEELYFITKALGIEDELDALRYEKIVIATDADVDGLHIRNLLMTFFLTFFERLVLNERLYVLETPLFRVRTKKETIYCYNKKEREDAVAKLGQKAEVTRFKGLGEISPKEFGQFIREDIRLIPVTVDSMRDVPEVLRFFMGKNTPVRRDYIMQNLM